MIGVSTGMFGAVWAQAETRKVLGALGGRVVEEELPVAGAAELYEDGRLELVFQSSPSSWRRSSPTLVAEAEQLREPVPVAA